MNIYLQNISKSYTGKILFEDQDFEIKDGSITVISGKNGSGKTTLLKIIVGLVKPESGKVIYRLNNHTITYNEAKKHMGYAGNSELLIENISGLNYFNFLRLIYKVPKNKYEKKLDELLKIFEIKKDIFLENITGYSAGYKKLTELLGAFLHNPNVVILDEPFVSLDSKFTAILKTYLYDMAKVNKTTIIVATHNNDFINNFSDYLISL